MASKACSTKELWQEYQTLNKRFLETTQCIEKLQQELAQLSENKWKQICTKSLHNIRNEIVLLQMKDKKLSQENKTLGVEVNSLTKEVQDLEKKRAQMQSKKK